MLKIKDTRWNEFKDRLSEFGFKLNDCNNAYFIRLYQEEEYPEEYLDVQIWLDDKSITIETSNRRYGGISTDGTELTILYDLIINGFVEKLPKQQEKETIK